MNADIRSHIIHNFKEDEIDAIRGAIEDTVKTKDEIALPGMGVFLELLWQGSDETLKNQILTILYKQIKET